MAQSIKRKIKRGNARVIWNNTFQRLDIFKRTSRGKFILANSNGQYLTQGPGHNKKTLDAWENNA